MAYQLLLPHALHSHIYEDVEFRFDAFRQFTPSRKAFLEVVDKTFRGVPFQQYLVFSWFMRKIRQRFVNEMYLKPLVLQAFVSFIFFKELGILPKSEHFRKGGHFMTELKEKRREKEEFFLFRKAKRTEYVKRKCENCDRFCIHRVLMNISIPHWDYWNL